MLNSKTLGEFFKSSRIVKMQKASNWKELIKQGFTILITHITYFIIYKGEYK